MQDLIVSNRTDKKIRTYLVGQDPMRGIFYRPLNQLHSHTVRDQAVQDQERNRILGEPLLNSGTWRITKLPTIPQFDIAELFGIAA